MKSKINSFRNDRQQAAESLALVSGIAVTWLLLWVWLAAMTEGWLAPWDTAPGRPPVGTIARTLNDFFEDPPGTLLPSTLFVIGSVSVFLYRLRRAGNTTALPLLFIASNLIFGVAVTVLAILAHRLPDLWLAQPRPALDPGYHRTWPVIVITAMQVIILLIAQLKWRLNDAPRHPGN